MTVTLAGAAHMDMLVLDAAAFLETLSPDLQAFAGPLVNVDARRMEEEYFALFAYLPRAAQSERVRPRCETAWRDQLEGEARRGV